MNKYHARKCTIAGITFDSRKEANRYMELSLLQQAGEISNLEVHPRYEILTGFEFQGEKIRKAEYEADFTYIDHGRRVIEDVKSEVTKTPLFSLKMKLLKSRMKDVTELEIKVIE